MYSAILQILQTSVTLKRYSLQRKRNFVSYVLPHAWLRWFGHVCTKTTSTLNVDAFTYKSHIIMQSNSAQTQQHSDGTSHALRLASAPLPIFQYWPARRVYFDEVHDNNIPLTQHVCYLRLYDSCVRRECQTCFWVTWAQRSSSSSKRERASERSPRACARSSTGSSSRCVEKYMYWRGLIACCQSVAVYCSVLSLQFAAENTAEFCK